MSALPRTRIIHRNPVHRAHPASIQPAQSTSLPRPQPHLGRLFALGTQTDRQVPPSCGARPYGYGGAWADAVSGFLFYFIFWEKEGGGGEGGKRDA